MKRSIVPILVICSLLSFGAHVRADDDHEGDGDHHGDHHSEQGEDCQGGDIDGSESLVATVTLTPTTNAPADASGLAKLISRNEDGTVTSSFSLSITGLTTGVYDLSVVRKSDGSTVDLGQFAIGGSCQDDGESDSENDDQGDADDNEGGGGCCRWAAFLDEGDVQLPSDLDPMDIAQILVSDTNGLVLLTGDLVNPSPTSSIKFTAKLRVHSASGVTTTLSNKAQAQSSARRGRRTDRFTMIASGVAPNTMFSVKVNGQSAGTVKSNRKGKVLVRKIPANLLLVKSVHLVDPNGQTAVQAKF
jgi:hypothetical protein